MLVLTRKPGESIAIGDDVRVRVVAVEGARVRLGIEAPPEIAIRRRELPIRRPQACGAASAAAPVSGK